MSFSCSTVLKLKSTLLQRKGVFTGKAGGRNYENITSAHILIDAFLGRQTDFLCSKKGYTL